MSDLGLIRENEQLKAECAGLKDGGNHHGQPDTQFTISQPFLWIVGIVFTLGCLYNFVMRIPAIEKEQAIIKLDVNTLQANYASIEKWMEKIDRKIDRSNNGR